MAQNLFQKYCPQILDDVVGQKVAIKELQKRILENNIPQCTYFTGETGVGKTVISRIIAKSILCEDKGDSFCNKCNVCKSINNETYLLNYFEINASNCGIDQMREIEETASRKIGFTKSSCKVFYIDELQEMVSKNKVAMKNLLKLLEKPSKENYFILGSMDDLAIPKAVKNRCVTYKLKSIDPDSMFERLHFICTQEGKDISDSEIDVLNCVISNSDGSLRTAISLLERILYSDLWTEERVLDELSLLSDTKIINIVNDLLSGNVKNMNYALYNTSVIDKIRSKLLLLYRAYCDGQISPRDKKELSSIIESNLISVERSIEILNELLKYNYASPQLIEFYLMKAMSKNKSGVKQLRRKRV